MKDSVHNILHTVPLYDHPCDQLVLVIRLAASLAEAMTSLVKMEPAIVVAVVVKPVHEPVAVVVAMALRLVQPVVEVVKLLKVVAEVELAVERELEK